MYGHVLHGTWLPSQQRFFVWGETPEPPLRRGRQARLPAHPFQSSPSMLREYLDARGVNASDAAEHMLTLWLPSVAKMPRPSPELLASGTPPPPEGQPELRMWQVTGLLLPAASARDLLLAGQGGPQVAPDLRAWRVGALLAMELVAGQQVMPALARDGFLLRAGWRPRPAPALAHKLAALARSLPPVCRAAVLDPARAPIPRTLVDDFLSAVVDSVIRRSTHKPRLPATTPGGKWMRALLGADPVVKLKGAEADELYRSWQSWAGYRLGAMRAAADDTFRVTFRLEAPEDDRDVWTLAYLLQATDDPSLQVPATLVWREQSPVFSYLDRRFEQPQERLLTALGYAARLFPPIEASLHHAAPEQTLLTATDAFVFLKEAAPLLEQSGFGVLVPAWWQGRSARLQARARASATSAPNQTSRLSFDTLVHFNWELTLAGQSLDRGEFERLVALKLPLVQVRGQWVVLDPDHIQQALAFFEQRDTEVPLSEALRLALAGDGATTPETIAVTGVEPEGRLRDLLDGLRDTQRIELLPPPDELQGALRPYQVRGYSWIAFLRQFGLGACLADDMGLGKSVQTISLLLYERERRGSREPALLVCPTSVVGNWVRELERFAPVLRVMTHRGQERLQSEDFEREAAAHDLVLTSYPLLARDLDTLRGVAWDTLILDEAQNIKNAAAKQAQAARAIEAGHRVALTGTPVENRLSELWSIMAFLNPGYLGSEAAFRREFARPIERTGDPQALERLRRLTSPFVLRRLKTDPAIISDLPDKLEMNVYCSLTPEQATLYEAVVQGELAQIDAAETEGNAIRRRGQVLAMLMKLKQVCNHPAQFLKDRSSIAGRSGKLARLQEMIEEVYAEGDRALIFTQFAEMGTLLQRHLEETFGEDVLFLHGTTPPKERDTMIRRFQAPGGPRLFILSLKAGGTGLNLTAANHVFHFDRWWNPAVENQATDRAFRIGQTRNVQVHKFICGGTLEDHIDEMIESKRTLAESVLGADESWLTELSTSQLHDLVALRHAEVAEE